MTVRRMAILSYAFSAACWRSGTVPVDAHHPGVDGGTGADAATTDLGSSGPDRSAAPANDGSTPRADADITGADRAPDTGASPDVARTADVTAAPADVADAAVMVEPDGPFRDAREPDARLPPGSTLWVQSAPTAQQIAVAPNGDIVLAGDFYFETDFGGGPLTKPVGSADLAVCRYGPDGGFKWAKAIGSAGWDAAHDVVIDAADTIFVAAASTGPVDFGGGVLPGGPRNSLYLASYSASGQHRFSRALLVNAYDLGGALELDGADLLLTGNFLGSITLEGGMLGGSTTGEAGFLARYAASGAPRSVKQLNVEGGVVTYDLVRARDGDLVVAGRFVGSPSFGGTGLVSAGMDDGFVARLGAAGEHRWSRRFGGSGQDRAWAVGIDRDGSVVIGGSFSGSVAFGNQTLTSVGGHDAVVAKLSGSGEWQWARGFGGVEVADDREHDRVAAVTTDSAGGIIVVGHFADSLGAEGVRSNGGEDVFVVNLSTAGNVVWARGYGSPYPGDQGWSVGWAADGRLLVSGFAPGANDFGTGRKTFLNGFLMKLTP